MTKMRSLIDLVEGETENPELTNTGTFRVRIYNPQMEYPLTRPFIDEIIEGSQQKARWRLEELWNEHCCMQPGRGWRGILHQKGSKGYLHLITG